MREKVLSLAGALTACSTRKPAGTWNRPLPPSQARSFHGPTLPTGPRARPDRGVLGRVALVGPDPLRAVWFVGAGGGRGQVGQRKPEQDEDASTQRHEYRPPGKRRRGSGWRVPSS